MITPKGINSRLTSILRCEEDLGKWNSYKSYRYYPLQCKDSGKDISAGSIILKIHHYSELLHKWKITFAFSCNVTDHFFDFVSFKYFQINRWSKNSFGFFIEVVKSALSHTSMKLIQVAVDTIFIVRNAELHQAQP